MNIGSKMMLSPFDNTKAHIAIEASPAPLKIALIKKSSIMVTLPPNSTWV